MENMKQLLEEAVKYAEPFLTDGHAAAYLSHLEEENPSFLGVSMIRQGKLFEAGDTGTVFSMQSVAKVFSLILALETAGAKRLFSRVGASPSEALFNSLPPVIEGKCIPANPMLNAGCFVTLDSIKSKDVFELFLSRVRKLCGSPNIRMSEAVYQAEQKGGGRNREILEVLKENGSLKGDAEFILDLHMKTSSVEVTTADLAYFGAVLSGGGKDPVTGEELVDPEIVRTVKTVMFQCGMYNGTGDYNMRVGIPSKSGVSGCIAAVGKNVGIAVFSPALDTCGNSVGGQKVLEYLSGKLKLHAFDV